MSSIVSFTQIIKYKKIAYEKGILKPLIKCLDNKNNIISKLTLYAIGNICQFKEAKNSFRENKGIIPLVKLLNNNDESIIDTTRKVISCLQKKNNENKLAFTKERRRMAKLKK